MHSDTGERLTGTYIETERVTDAHSNRQSEGSPYHVWYLSASFLHFDHAQIASKFPADGLAPSAERPIPPRDNPN